MVRFIGAKPSLMMDEVLLLTPAPGFKTRVEMLPELRNMGVKSPALVPVIPPMVAVPLAKAKVMPPAMELSLIALEPSAPVFVTINDPLVTKVGPVKVLVAVSVKVPEPVSVKDPVPLITFEKVPLVALDKL